ncbi:hypothetical protein PTTG_27473 [Puccinia triticina 1-1 BBBD Race 1]|uniref:F-box domain-containing protein n=2 Tax=Puccinia triticina TaxID=208348 RepID=A0A180GLR2_PUCT1|nr:uncharacterized protein PtA15_6A695 [Puccinia triticina]OAV92903.1 hypothetical protein PTTG_27473 [Puccinia triticina 1-1 BBBD Race 1]WAQ86065.1 hypothetical protein PtA15_6A695 [Puccinia triticina]WAR55957.1 hypothetical protein PtB15_6B701 [Puccinia triticina]
MMTQGYSFLTSELIRSCPLIECIVIHHFFFGEDEESIFEALASRQRIQEFSTTGHWSNRPEKGLSWRIDEAIDRLLSKWKFLHTIDFRILSGPQIETEESTIPPAIPILNHALRSVVLTEPDLDEIELSSILKSSAKSLFTLKILCPTSRLDRPGLYRTLTECTNPGLKS